MTLEQLFRILRARWLTALVLAVATVAAVAGASLVWPKAYTANAELVIDVRNQDPISGQAQSAQLLTSYVATQADIIRSPSVAARVMERLGLEQNPGILAEYQKAGSNRDLSSWLIARLTKALKVGAPREGGVLTVAVTDKDPQLAAALANAYAEIYLETNLQLRTEPARRYTEWYDQQVQSLRLMLEQAQERLTAHQLQHGVLAVAEQLDIENARLAELSSMLVAAQAQRLEHQSRRNQFVRDGGGGLADVQSSPVIQKLKAELAGAEVRFEEIAARVGANHPRYRQAEQEVEALRAQLAQEIESVGRSMRSSTAISADREKELAAALAAQKSRILQLNRARDELALLQQEVENARTAYSAALRQAAQSRLESQLRQTDVALLSSAMVPLKPSSPKLLLNLVAGLFLGALLGIGAALLRELRDRRVRSISDIEEQLRLPVISYLPATRSGRGI